MDCCIELSFFLIAYAHCMVFRCLLLSDHHVFFFFVANFSASEWVEWHWPFWQKRSATLILVQFQHLLRIAVTEGAHAFGAEMELVACALAVFC